MAVMNWVSASIGDLRGGLLLAFEAYHGLDLDACAGGQGADLHGRAGRAMLAEAPCEDGVHGREFAQVGHEHGDLDDPRQRAVATEQDGLEVVEDLFGLGRDVALALLASGRQRDLTRGYNQPSTAIACE